MKNPQYIVYGIIAAILIGFLAISSYRQQWLQGEMGKEKNSQQEVGVSEEVKEVKQLNERVVVKEYENYKIVEVDGGKMVVELPGEAVVTENNPYSVFNVVFYGKNEISEGGRFSAGLAFNSFDIDRVEKLRSDKENTLVNINQKTALKYKKHKASPEATPENTSIEYYFTQIPYSMNCVAYQPEMEKFIKICEEIFENKITFN